VPKPASASKKTTRWHLSETALTNVRLASAGGMREVQLTMKPIHPGKKKKMRSGFAIVELVVPDE